MIFFGENLDFKKYTRNLVANRLAKPHNNNVSSTNSKEFKLCVNSSFNIDTRLFRKTAIRSQCSKHVDNEIIETSMP